MGLLATTVSNRLYTNFSQKKKKKLKSLSAIE